MSPTSARRRVLVSPNVNDPFGFDLRPHIRRQQMIAKARHPKVSGADGESEPAPHHEDEQPKRTQPQDAVMTDVPQIVGTKGLADDQALLE
jgi:hypothetical protein